MILAQITWFQHILHDFSINYMMLAHITRFFAVYFHPGSVFCICAVSFCVPVGMRNDKKIIYQLYCTLESK